MKKEVVKQLKSDYEELEIKPSARLWDQIDEALEKQSESTAKSLFSLHWWKYAAAILLLISLGTLIYHYGDFNTEKTDYFVQKKVQEKEFKADKDTLKTIQEDDQWSETNQTVVKENHQKIEQTDVENLKQEKEIILQTQFSEPAETIAINEVENPIKKETIENKNTPEISDTRKISYITANELLLGSELDKSREKANAETRKFGVINRDKLLPKFKNVTVLGVTVYIDPK